MNRLRRLAACSLALFFSATVAAWAHPERISGVVVSTLPHRHQVVLSVDAIGSKPAQTKLFPVSPRVDLDALHAGDRIIGLADDDRGAVTLDQIRVVPVAGSQSAIRPAIPLLVGDHIPATRFIDQRGRSFSLADFRGTWVVLAFVYTRCEDQRECPLVSSHFRILQRRIANGPYHLVEITIDPSYDRPKILARYGTRFGADPNRWTLGTGDPETVLDFAARFGIDPFADPRIGLIHTERTAMIDPDGKIIDFIDQADWNPDNIIARLQPEITQPTTLLERLNFELSKVTVAICGNDAKGFSGLQDLAIVLAILGSIGFALSRVARFFLTH